MLPPIKTVEKSASLALPIAKPPWTNLGRELESALRKAIFDFSLIDQTTQKIAVALSGGKDSLSLLYLLHAIRGRGFPNFELYAIHMEGEYSCGAGIDGSFLGKICKEIEVPLLLCHSERKLEQLECYSCSRERRKAIFAAARGVGAETIAFGHHRDDSAQTLLLNLLHKAEFAANLPKVRMQDFGVTIIRPLIYIAERDLRKFAEEYRFLRISCQCPVGQNSKRKEVDRLISLLEEAFPNARSNLAKAGLLFGSQKAMRP
ncbi:MAG: tRNA 2-thiocytidine biosynthesis protein TtcA [Verrucomicrobiota bacterium]|nr:tRNA 2-thiocytidine biosynthesis protein TtcA [Verrucomicrobiota bacterium]